MADLKLVFSQGKTSKTITISNPKTGLTKGDVQKVMEDIVNRKALLAKNEPVDGIKAAYLSEVIVTELAA